MGTFFSPPSLNMLGGEKEAFRGGLLSPGPSASAPSVKNDEATLILEEEVRPESGGGDVKEEDDEEENGNHQIDKTAVAQTPKPHHLNQEGIEDQPAEESPPTRGEPTPSKTGVVVTPRPVINPTPKRTSSSQIFFKKPSSRETMTKYTKKTPSSRPIVSSSLSRSASSSSKQPKKVEVPVTIHILALADRDNHQYDAVQPKHTCTLNLVSYTKTKEVCLHTAEHMRRKCGVVLDGSRFEARDLDGHLLSPGETISEEVMDGEAMYLIEDAVSEMGKGKKREDLARSQGMDRTGRRKGNGSMVAYRTPSLSSRTSSSVKKWSRAAKSEPRKRITAAQKALELAQTWSVPRPPNPRKKTGSGVELPLPRALDEPLHSETSATPAKEATVLVPSAASPTPRKKWTAKSEPPKELQEKESNALAEVVVASQQSLPSPESSPAPRDNDNTQSVIPDSQEDPESSCPSPKTTPVQTQLPAAPAPAPAVPPMPSRPVPENVPQPPATRPRSAPPTRPVDTLILAPSSIAPPQSLPSRPDPYDISTVLSDDENYSPRPQQTIMSSCARKLGSSRNHSSTARPPFASSYPARTAATRPSSPMVINKFSSAAVDQTVIVSTPVKSALTPKRGSVSSPAAPLPSSPTNHVNAAIAKGRAKAIRAPPEDAVVVYDSSDDVDENILHEAPDRFSSLNQSQPSETAAHWSGPPLQLSQDLDPFWPVRSVGRRPRTITNEDDEHTKAQLRRLGELGGSHATRIGSGQSKPQPQPSSGVSPKANSSAATPCKKAPTNYAGRYPLGLPVKSPCKTTLKVNIGKSPVIEIHGSSSERSSKVDNRSPDKELSATGQTSSPPKDTEAIVISDTSSQYESEGENQNALNEQQLVPAAERSPRTDDPPSAEELPISDLPPLPLPDGEEQELPILREETPPFSTALEEITPSQSKAAPLVELPLTDPLVDIKSEESPPSAQPSKRKREPSGEPDPEEEDRKKKARRDERKARRLQRREERKARALEEQVQLEEERKRLALEQAQRRAQELEVTLSSPSKAAKKTSRGYESSQDSDAGYDQSPPTPESPSVAELAVFEGDDNNDSLSSRETEGRLSWRKLSKRHFSESPKCNQKQKQQVVRSTNTPSPSTVPAGTGVQDSQPEPERPVAMKQRFEREIYDDWAFLEEHLGRSQVLLDVHNRMHMQMMHQGIWHTMEPGRKEVAEPAAEKTSKAAAKSQTDAPAKSNLESKVEVEKEAHEDQELREWRSVQKQAGDTVSTPRSDRAAAPSPKDFSAARATASKGDGAVKDKTKSQSRKKQRDLSRKNHWKQKRKAGSFKKIRRALMKK